MKKSERIRDRYPIFGAFLGQKNFLSIEEAAAATRDQRIESVWPFIVRRVLSFNSTLKPRERSNFDAEDVLSEIWVELSEKDGDWNPERGKYITFVGKLIDRHFCTIREKARTVHSPRNASCRTKEYQEEEAAGSLTEARRKTFADIRRTGEAMGSISHSDRIGDPAEGQQFLADESSMDPLDFAASSFDADLCRDAARQAMRGLTPPEAKVISLLYGFGGRRPMTLWDIAFDAQEDVNEVRKIANAAQRKIKRHLTDLSHPATKLH